MNELLHEPCQQDPGKRSSDVIDVMQNHSRPNRFGSDGEPGEEGADNQSGIEHLVGYFPGADEQNVFEMPEAEEERGNDDRFFRGIVFQQFAEDPSVEDHFFVDGNKEDADREGIAIHQASILVFEKALDDGDQIESRDDGNLNGGCQFPDGFELKESHRLV